MSKYATGTDVSPGRSREEIERILMRYGADSFGYANNRESIVIQFRIHDRMYRMMIKLPSPESFKLTPSGKYRRDQDTMFQEWEKEVKRIWRVLALGIKAKLELVQAGVSTVEVEFMPYTLLPDGKTVFEFMEPQIALAYQTGQMPALLEFRR